MSPSDHGMVVYFTLTNVKLILFVLFLLTYYISYYKIELWKVGIEYGKQKEKIRFKANMGSNIILFRNSDS